MKATICILTTIGNIAINDSAIDESGKYMTNIAIITRTITGIMISENAIILQPLLDILHTSI